MSNFDPMFTELPPVLANGSLPSSSNAKITLTDSMQEHFKGFSFVNTQSDVVIPYHSKRRSSRSSDSSGRSRSSSTRSVTRPESFEEPFDMSALRRMLPPTAAPSTWSSAAAGGSGGPTSPALRATSPIVFAHFGAARTTATKLDGGGRRGVATAGDDTTDVFDGVEGGILLAPDEGDEDGVMFEEEEELTIQTAVMSAAPMAGQTTLAA